MARAKKKQADEWQDQPKQHRPTPEQRKKAQYGLEGTERPGIKKAVNKTSTPLRRALFYKKLTLQQVEAGERFEEIYTSVYGRGGSRDSLDMSPRSGFNHESDQQGLFIANQKKRLENMQFSMDAYTARVLFDTCVKHDPIGDCRPAYKRYAAIVMALDIVVDYLKNGKKRKM